VTELFGFYFIVSVFVAVIAFILGYKGHNYFTFVLLVSAVVAGFAVFLFFIAIKIYESALYQKFISRFFKNKKQGFNVKDNSYPCSLFFEPYTIQFIPKWHEILKDWDLPEDDQWKWREVRPERDDHEPLISNITFTVLEDDDRCLIYDNNRLTFHRSINFVENFKNIEIPAEEGGMAGPTGYRGFDNPAFFVRKQSDNYEIGIRNYSSFKVYRGLAEAYADNFKNPTIASISINNIYCIKMSEFTFDVLDALKNEGWTCVEEDAPLPWQSRIPICWRYRFDHKYYRIYYKKI
jgi:hypothetical protein